MKPPELPVTPPELDASLRAVLGEIDRPADAWTQLRALPTPARVALGVLVAVVLASAIIAILGTRSDLPDPLPARFAAGMTMLGVGAVVTAALSLRGLHQPPLGRRGLAIAAVVSLGVWATPLITGLWPGGGGHGGGLGCLAVGTLAAGLAGGALVGLARARALPLEQRALAGVSGGLVGFAMNEAWCAAGDLPHLMLGHASLAVLGAVLIAAVSRPR